MKLNVDFTGIENALRAMGGTKASIGALRETVLIKNPMEYELLERGEIVLETQEDLDSLIFPAGLIAIGNTQVTLHILDPFEDEESLSEVPARKTRFHIFDCKKLNEMRQRGRFDRYVASSRKDNLFTVRPYDNIEKLRGEKMEAQLAPCRYCLNELDYNGYGGSSKSERNDIVASFSTEDFFETNHHIFRCLPLYTSETFPEGNYTADWARISANFRSKMKWICNCCGVDLQSNKGLLHAHHIDGNRGNNRFSNLRALCVTCHKAQPMHERMGVKPEEKIRLQRLKVNQSLEVNCSKCEA